MPWGLSVSFFQYVCVCDQVDLCVFSCRLCGMWQGYKEWPGSSGLGQTVAPRLLQVQVLWESAERGVHQQVSYAFIIFYLSPSRASIIPPLWSVLFSNSIQFLSWFHWGEIEYSKSINLSSLSSCPTLSFKGWLSVLRERLPDPFWRAVWGMSSVYHRESFGGEFRVCVYWIINDKALYTSNFIIVYCV